MTPKWAWLAALGGAALALLLARGLTARPIRVPLAALWGTVAAWVAWNWISVFWAASRGLAVDRAARLTWLFLLFWLGLHVFRTRRHLVWMARAGVAIGLATAIWVLHDDYLYAFHPESVGITANLSDWRGYLAAGLGNTSHIGDLLALAMLPTLVLFGLARGRFWKWTLGAIAALLPAGLIVSYSVDSNGGLILGAGLMTALVWRATRGRFFLRRWRRWAMLLVAWVAVVGYYNVDLPVNPHHPGILKQGFGSERWHEGGPTRLVIWAGGLQMIREHGILGVGAGNFTYRYPAMDPAWVRNDPELATYRGLWTNAAHNVLIQTWAELGVVGFALFVTIVVLAYLALLRGLGESDRPDFYVRVTLAGMLTCWLSEAQMNFALQHPAGALTFFALLMATLAERDARARRAGMPPLLNETGPLELTLEWENMEKPTAVGAALRLPEAATRAACLAVAACAVAWAMWATRPVIAQREYRRAMEALQRGDAEAANTHFLTALDYNPGAVDVRSRYSDVLINSFHAPEPGLAQLAIVRRRLDSSELWLREAQGLMQEGKPAEARKAYDTYAARLGATSPNLQPMPTPMPAPAQTPR